MKKIHLLFFLFILALSAFSQQVFQKKLPLSSSVFDSKLNAVIQGVDSGYLIASTENTTSNPSGYVYILKINEIGNLQWSKTYDGPFFEGQISIKKIDDDSTYIAYGLCQSFNLCDTYDMFVMKLKLNGDTIWTKHFGSCSGDVPEEVVKGPDGGYYIYGSYGQSGIFIVSTSLIRLNSQGDTVWTRLINLGGAPSFPVLKQQNYACASTSDGGIIATGMVFDSTDHPRHSYLMKIDSNGTVQWQKFYDKPNFNSIGAIYTTSSGYLITGMCSLNGFSVFDSIYWAEYGTMIMKTDFNGNPVWAKMYKDMIFGGYPRTTPHSSLLLNNNNIFIASVRYRYPFNIHFSHNGYHRNMISFMTDSTGALVWGKKYNIAADDIVPESAYQTRDNGFLIRGNSNFYDTGSVSSTGVYSDLLVKTDSLGNSCNDSILTMGIVDFTSQIVTSDTITPQISYYPIVLGHAPFTIGSGITYQDICSGNVGIQELYKPPERHKLIVYPNPASNEINVLFNLPQDVKEGLFTITDVTGRKLASHQVFADGKLTISTSNYAKGVYFCTLRESEKTKVIDKIKLVIIN